MSKYQVSVQHLPSIPTKQISRIELHQRLTNLWDWKKLKLTDNYYFYPSWEDWDKVFLYVMAKLPKYVPNKFDCENFAGYIRVKVAELFGINCAGDAEGYADLGRGMERHGWTVFFDGEGLYQIESQKRGGLLMDIDDSNYCPDELVMG